MGLALVFAWCALGVAALFPAGPAGAADRDGITFSASLDGRTTGSLDAGHPLRISPNAAVSIAIKVHNGGSAPVFVRSVRLQSRVAGVLLFASSTRIDLNLPGGATATRTLDADLGDVRSQATGLLPAEVALLGPQRSQLASEALTVDVRGSLLSVYGLFGIAIALITIGLLISGMLRLVTGRQPANRWRRAIPFAVIGVGVGLTLTFSLSALRIFAATPSLWILLIVIGGLAGFAFGFTTPNPTDGDDDDDDDLVDAPEPTPAMTR